MNQKALLNISYQNEHIDFMKVIIITIVGEDILIRSKQNNELGLQITEKSITAEVIDKLLHPTCIWISNQQNTIWYTVSVVSLSQTIRN